MPYGRKRKRSRALAAAVAAAVVVVGGGWWFFRGFTSPAAARESQDSLLPDGQEAALAGLQEPPSGGHTGGGSSRSGAVTADEPPPGPANQPLLLAGSEAVEEEILSPRGVAAEASLTQDTGRPSAATEIEETDADPDADAQADGVAGGSLQPAPTGTANDPAVRQAIERYRSGAVIEARHELNRLLKTSLPEGDAAEVRRTLAQIARETIFIGKRPENDPLLEQYRVKSGDALVRIARGYDVPPEAIMRFNRITQPSNLQINQPLVIPRGPFHAKIHRGKFRLDLYLQDLYVGSFPVGLGAEQGTPTGVWMVKNRLKDPTYYPPASAPDKRIIPPHDPTNPLGGYWIGLEGKSGDAVGREGYGIHGTIEPDSIGKNASLGCVRMHAEDIALVYSVLQPGSSTVEIVP